MDRRDLHKRLLRRSSFLQAHQWTFCGLDLGNVGEAWEAINLIDNAFPRKHLIGSVSSHKDLIASFGRVWRTCDACDERSALAARPTSTTQQTKDIVRTKQSDTEKEESSGATRDMNTVSGAQWSKVVEALLPDGSFKPGTGSAVALNVIRAIRKYNGRNSIDTEAYLGPIAYNMSQDQCFSRMNDDILQLVLSLNWESDIVDVLARKLGFGYDPAELKLIKVLRALAAVRKATGLPLFADAEKVVDSISNTFLRTVDQGARNRDAILVKGDRIQPRQRCMEGATRMAQAPGG